MKEDIKALINSELDALKGHTDEEFNPPIAEPRFIESKGKLDEEALALDELLAGIPKAQGYYLKLYKEIGTNNFEYKLKIDNWETWTDFEHEIREIVKNHTQKNPIRWGSGHYRVIIWREAGIREKRRPVDLFIDADEPPIIPGMQYAPQPPSASENISSLKDLLEVTSKLNPTVSPSEQLKANSDAFMKGMEMAQSKENSSNNALATAMQSMSTMMMGFITLMMNQNNNKPAVDDSHKINPVEMLKSNVEMFKNMGAFDKPEPKKEKTLVEQITELKALGFFNNDKPKSILETIAELKAAGLMPTPGGAESPVAKINEVKEMVALASELAGIGKSDSSTLDKVVEMLVPKVPDMISNVAGAVSNYADAVKTRHRGQAPGNVTTPINNEANINKEGDDTMLFGFHPLFKELYTAIEMHDNTKFPYIVDRIKGLLGEQLIKDIVIGHMDANKLSEMIQTYGGHRFKDAMFVTGKMTPYLNEFVMWCRATYDVAPTATTPAPNAGNVTPLHIVPPTTNVPATATPAHPEWVVFMTQCNKCGDPVEWSSEEAFTTDNNHTCGLELQPGKFCDGTLLPISVGAENVEGAHV